MHPNTHTYTIHKKTDIKERERNIKLWKSFVKIDVRKTGSHSRSNLNNSINYFLSSSPNSTGFAKFVYSKLSSLFFWMESTFLLIYRISFRIGSILIFSFFLTLKKKLFHDNFIWNSQKRSQRWWANCCKRLMDKRSDGIFIQEEVTLHHLEQASYHQLPKW